MTLTGKSNIVVPKGFYGKTSVLQGYDPQDKSLVDLAVTRATTATRINEAGNIESVAANVPRRDFLNGGCGQYLNEPQRTNLFLNSATGATQTVTVTSGTIYSVSFSGTGSITFSGGATGTLNGTGATAKDRVETQITPSTTSVTCTISGTVEYVNFEEGEVASSSIETTASVVTRNKDLTSIDLSTEGVSEKYALLFNVQSDGGRLLMSSTGAGFDLDIKNSGKFAMLVDLNTITFKFPNNGQPQTELVYEKPADFRNIDFEAKLGPVRVDEVIWTEELQPAEYNAWLSGTVSSDFLETDWSVQTNFEDEFIEEDWGYFPVIDTSSGNNFKSAWFNNQLTYFPLLDVSSGTNFRFAWSENQLTSFPQLDTSSGTDFEDAWSFNNLTSFPLLDVSSGTNFRDAWRFNNLTSFPLLDVSSGINFLAAWGDNQLTSFPFLDVSSGTNFFGAWENNQLTSFPANRFDALTSPQNDCFVNAWAGTNVIDAQGMENILVSIDTSGANAPASGVDIGISSNGDALTAATNTAITSLKGKDWTVTIDGVAQ